MVKRVLVAFDFDHTLITENSDTYILRLLPDGTDLPQSIRKLYSTAGWNDYQREVFRYLHSLHVTKDQLLSCVAEIPLIEGMRELLEYLAASSVIAVEANAENESCVKDVEIHDNVAVDRVLPLQQQCTMINDAGAVPLAVASEFSRPAVCASSALSHSVVDGKDVSASAVQFDAIIVSDSNSVSISCQSVWLFLLTFALVSFVSRDLQALMMVINVFSVVLF